MKKRILCLFLTVLMVLSATVVASAIGETETNPEPVALTLDLAAAQADNENYGKSVERWAATLDAATFKVRCTLDMAPVRETFAKIEALKTASGADADLVAKFNEFKTTGTFTVTVTYTNATVPTTVDLPAATAQYFKIAGTDTSVAGTTKITIATKDGGLTTDDLRNGALDDITLTISGIGGTAFGTTATVSVAVEGKSHSTRGGSTHQWYAYSTSAETVSMTPKKTSSGTGTSGTTTSRYTLTFDVDGDTSLVSSIRREEGTELKTADFKIPHKDGYTFKGWFLDKAMTEKVGETVKLTKNMTVYGGFEKVGGASAEISGKLETVDHFAYVSGYPDGTVRPEANITREETAMVFYRLLNAIYRASVDSKTNNFGDVAAERWSNDAISTLVNAGILSGYPDGTFNPSAAITRAEFATLVTRFVGIDETATHSFTDLGGHWAEKYVATAVKLGWIAGYDDGTFRPDGKITRAEAMTLVNRILYRFVNAAGHSGDAVKWPDNTESKWYYFAVQEATNGHDYGRQDDGVYESWTGLKK